MILQKIFLVKEMISNMKSKMRGVFFFVILCINILFVQSQPTYAAYTGGGRVYKIPHLIVKDMISKGEIPSTINYQIFDRWNATVETGTKSVHFGYSLHPYYPTNSGETVRLYRDGDLKLRADSGSVVVALESSEQVLEQFPIGYYYWDNLWVSNDYNDWSASKNYYHLGMDFAVGKGSSLFAVADGQIIYIDFIKNGEYFSYGKCALLQFEGNDGNRYEMIYAHLDRFPDNVPVYQTDKYMSEVRVTDEDGLYAKRRSIQADDRVGYVGTTGNSGGNHLHIDMQRKNLELTEYKYYITPAQNIQAVWQDFLDYLGKTTEDCMQNPDYNGYNTYYHDAIDDGITEM